MEMLAGWESDSTWLSLLGFFRASSWRCLPTPSSPLFLSWEDKGFHFSLLSPSPARLCAADLPTLRVLWESPVPSGPRPSRQHLQHFSPPHDCHCLCVCVSHWMVTTWCIFLRLCSKTTQDNPAKWRKKLPKGTDSTARRPASPSCLPGSVGQTPLGSGAATCMFTWLLTQGQTTNRWTRRHLGAGFLSPLFGEKEQGSGINFVVLFLRNKKTELPLH